KSGNNGMGSEQAKKYQRGLNIRTMILEDLPFCRHLTAQAGWNQLDADWQRAIELEPSGCFVGVLHGEPVATTTVCCFGKVAWIAMVLVEESFRRQGIARQMLDYALEYCVARAVSCIRLDATKYGWGLYNRLGFTEEYELIRFTGQPEIKGQLE